MKYLLGAALSVALAGSASAQSTSDTGPGPVPSPWGFGADLSLYYDNGGITVPSTVAGGAMGVGTINADAIYIGGVPVSASNIIIGSPVTGTCANGFVLYNNAGGLDCKSVSGTGTVTSVAISAPSFLTVAGSPITTTGTLALSLASQANHLVFMGPATGGPLAPTFRALVASDLPANIGLAEGSVTISGTCTNGQYLYNNNGILGCQTTVASGIEAGTTTVTGTCTNGQALYNNAGVLGCQSAGTGTVSSVALALPAFITVSGSPVTTTGTLTGTLATQTAHLAFIGPASGGAAAPTFRALVASDMPAGTGTVTSVALTVPSFLAVSGSPITAAGTLGLTLNSQTANQVFAAPSGASGTPGFRALTTADMPAGTGTVTSVAATVPSFLSVAGSPVSTAGTLAFSLATQTANTHLSGPTTGSAAAPTFRTLVPADLPAAIALVGGTATVSGTCASGTFLYNNAGVLGCQAAGVGGVSSVGLALPSFITVTGSPVTGTGTLTGTLATQTANTHFAGPASGGAAAPTFRALVTADMPAGTGTVTSVGVTAPSFLSVANSPITTTGNVALSLATQTNHSVLAAPNGSDGVPAFRLLAGADIPAAIALTSGTATIAGTCTSGQFLYNNAGVLGCQAAGGVSSVGLALPSFLTVSGSPVTSAGTLTAVLAAQAAHAVLIGPTSGGAVAPAFRTLSTSDMPAGTGTVTSVGLTTPSFLTMAGTPVTTTGTMAMSLATQANHSVFAAPDGADGIPTFRQLTVDDIPGICTGAGTVTSVALTAPSFLNVTGSPIVSAGTLNMSLASQTQKTFLGAPAAADGTPSFRALAAGDLPAGTGTCTSVGLSLPSIFTISGSPVSTSGTITASLATQAVNTVFAGPASGGSAAPTFRAMAIADVPLLTQTGTGAVGYSYDRWIKTNAIRPQDFGATCDGVADDTAALTSWAAALGPKPGYVPGICRTTTGLTFPITGRRLIIIGDGPTASGLVYTGATTNLNAFIIGPSTRTGTPTPYDLRDISFDTATTMTGGSILFIRNEDLSALQNNIQNVYVGAGNNIAFTAVTMSNPGTTNVDHFWFHSTNHTAWEISGTCGAYCNINNGGLYNSGLGMHIGGGVGGLYTSMVSFGGNQQDLLIDETTTGTTNLQLEFGNFTTFDLTSTASSPVQIGLSGANPQQVVMFNNAWFSSGTVQGQQCDLQIDSGYAGYLKITGSVFTSSKDGICNSSTTARAQISNNYFYFNSQYGINNKVTNTGIIAHDNFFYANSVGTVNGIAEIGADMANAGHYRAGSFDAHGKPGSPAFQPDFIWSADLGLGNAADQNNADFVMGGTAGNQMCLRFLNDAFSSAFSAFCINRTGFVPTSFVMGTAMKYQQFTIATLPACNAGSRGYNYLVIDTVASGAPTYHGTVTGGGATTVTSNVICNGSVWQWD